ncbi:MAG: primosomal protein N' [Calditrichaceae bacterium]|nr:primosomal protein N' [Calditrichaceae bacterium]MBN2710059.1 primosomal protein N' [Calditrichaceae bacterium]RQV97732.1 MAG: primosomal protein N' [Calditrichota bacterium]
MPFVEVVFNLPIHHAFTYQVPPDIQDVMPGMRVYTPFGNRTITGVIVSVKEKTDIKSVRMITDVLDEKPLLDEKMLEFTFWIAEYYMCGWGQAVHLALPKGIDEYETTRIETVENQNLELLTERQRELYLLIGANPGNTSRYYKKKFGAGSFNFLIGKLAEKGFIRKIYERQDARVGDKIRRFVQVPLEYKERNQQHEDYGKYLKRRPEVGQYMLDHLGQIILVSDFLKETGMAAATLQKMCAYDLCRIIEQKVEREPEFSFQQTLNITRLTDEQESVIKQLRQAQDKNEFSVHLLHGVTGSGKTQVYIEMLRKVLEKNRTGIILIPEIALTPQTVSRFQAAFSEKIAVFHSKMSAGERYDAWIACAQGRIRIACGPRSALFAPLRNIGLIVVDEEHESSYKQSETAPRYHARDAAVYRARQHNALVILGSATPSMESYFNARKGKYNLLEIRNRIDGIRLPQVTIVDMKYERHTGVSGVTLFSKLLVEKIAQRLRNKEQIILLQNRRGYSSFMQCKKCGFIPICPNCDISLTYHSWDQKLHCHLCGHVQEASYNCPVCGDKNIVYKGIGTQRIQNELLQIFPEINTLRMDQDTTKGKSRHDSILNAFGKGKAQVLLGTQMIAKGLDFPNVTLVGVISADIGLAIPDFRSPEKVFQLLTQVAGRAGRGTKTGEVIIQTMLPHHYAVQFAREHDFTGFYMEEIKHRADYNYPPQTKLIQILFSSPQSGDVIKYSRQVASGLRRQGKDSGTIFGPSPALVSRVQNNYRWQILVKLDKTGISAINKMKKLINEWVYKKKSVYPKTLQINIDVDPVGLF